MKRKLFTLLLAIGVLTAFQVNAQAQLKVRILVDSSDLAKTSLNVHDSFPNVKKVGLYNWLSFSGEKPSLKTSASDLKKDGSTEDSIAIQKDLFKDPLSVFKVEFTGSDSTQFKITPQNGTKAVTLEHRNGSTSIFSILKRHSKDEAENAKDGVLANFPKEWPVPDDSELDTDTIAGYLAYVPNPNKVGGLKLDTLDVSVALVGVDKKRARFRLSISMNLPFTEIFCRVTLQ
jgi:hypothetical protein